MSPIGSVAIDIFAKINAGSFAKVFSEVNQLAKEEGVKASRSYATGFDSMKSQFDGLVAVAKSAYSDMGIALADLQIKEAQINDLRARGFRQSTNEMIAAQQELNAAIAESTRLQVEAAAARDRAMLATPIGAPRGREDEEPRGRGGREDDRGRGLTPVPTGRLPRLGNALGFGAFAGTLLGGFDVARQSARFQDDLNRIFTQVPTENPQNRAGLERVIQQIAAQTGYGPDELAKVGLQVEKRGYSATGGPNGYRGSGFEQMLRTAAQLSKLEKIPLDEAVKGLSITAENYKISPDKLADLASGLNVAVGQSGTTLGGFASALPNVEVVARTSGFQNSDVWASLAGLTKAGLEPERAGMNLASLIRSITGQAGAPAQNMLNALLQEGHAGESAATIYNKSSQLGIGGTLDEIWNKAVLPNLTPDQQHVTLPAYFANAQAQENVDQMIGLLTTDAAKSFAENNAELRGGMLSPSKVRSTGKGGLASGLLAQGATPEDIDKLSQLATKFQQINGYSNILKNNQGDVQNIESVLAKVFSTVEAGRSAMILHGGREEQQTLKREIDTAHAETGAGGQQNVEGFGKAMDTAASQGERLKASLHNVAITLGDPMQGPLKAVLGSLADFGDWLKDHKAVLDGFAISLAAIGTAWAGLKGFKMGKGVFDEFVNAGKGINNFFNPPNVGGKGASEIGPINEQVQTAAAEQMGAAVSESGAQAAEAMGTAIKTGGTQAAGEMGAALKGGAAQVGETISSAEKTGGAAAGEEIAGAMRTAGATAGEEIAGAMDSSAGGLGGKIAGAMGPALAGLLGAQLADSLADRFDKSHHSSLGNVLTNNPLTAFGPWLWRQGSNLLDNRPITANVPGLGNVLGNAHGGIVGYAGGTDKVANPFGQPLMGVPDMGRDSILGMLPGGRAVGLRGGEGILTPDAVGMLGGKDGVDALNAGKNPWADPLRVGTTFYGSFAKGVAKYSPWGKYLTATSQTLDSLAQERENVDKERGHRGLPLEIQQMLASGIDPQQVLQALGAHQGKRGGWVLPNGRGLSGEDRSMPNLPSAYQGGGGGRGKTTWFGNEDTVHSVFSKYFPESEWPAFYNLEMHEAGFNPTAQNPKSTAYGIGQFLDQTWGQYGSSGKTSDLTTQADDMMKYIRGRYGSPNSAWGQYFNHPGGEGSYAHGGIVGYAGGGLLPIPLDNNGSGGFDFGGAGTGGPRPGPALPGPVPTQPPNPDAVSPRTRIDPNAPGVNRNPKDPGQYLPTRVGAHPPGRPGIEPPRKQQMIPGGTQPGGDRNIKENPSRPLEGIGKGFGVGGGLIGAAESAAAMGANAFAPGSGQAAQQLFQLANLAIGYGGQVVGIGIKGLMETFLPNDSPAADPSKNIFGKIALGIAGAHPGPKNIAGSHMQLQPKQDLDEGAMAAKQQPGGGFHVNIHGDVNNHGDQEHEGMQQAITKALFAGGYMANY